MKQFEIISFHPGRQHNLEQAVQVFKGFKSFRHLTSLYFDRQTVGRWGRISRKLASGLNRRCTELKGEVVDINPFPEFKLLLKRKAGYKLDYDHFLDRNRQFQEWILRRYAPPAVCIGFDTSSWKVFEAWKHQSFLVLDLSVAIPEYKLKLARQQGFDETFIRKQVEGDAPVYPVYDRELELADLVLCGSEFVKDSCHAHGVDPAKLFVLPYGADLSRFRKDPGSEKESKKIKIAFVGSVSLRKGADVLLKIWADVAALHPNAELHFYGNVQVAVPANQQRVYYHGFIDQEELIKELNHCQISVLPTFFEGSSLAIYQSMAMGLAVLTTPNAGSVIEDERNGVLVPYGDGEALKNKLLRLIEDEGYRDRLAQNAALDIRQYSWDAYGSRLRSLLRKQLAPVTETVFK